MIPNGRGSCTGSQVVLELILNGIAPAAFVLRQPDAILALGVIVADELFEKSIPMVSLGHAGFTALLSQVAQAADSAGVEQPGGRRLLEEAELEQAGGGCTAAAGSSGSSVGQGSTGGGQTQRKSATTYATVTGSQVIVCGGESKAEGAGSIGRQQQQQQKCSAGGGAGRDAGDQRERGGERANREGEGEGGESEDDPRREWSTADELLQASTLQLTEEERSMMEGGQGRAVAVAMRILARAAAVDGAPSLLEISQAHIDGCTYIGPQLFALNCLPSTNTAART